MGFEFSLGFCGFGDLGFLEGIGCGEGFLIFGGILGFLGVFLDFIFLGEFGPFEIHPKTLPRTPLRLSPT